MLADAVGAAVVSFVVLRIVLLWTARDHNRIGIPAIPLSDIVTFVLHLGVGIGAAFLLDADDAVVVGLLGGAVADFCQPIRVLATSLALLTKMRSLETRSTGRR